MEIRIAVVDDLEQDRRRIAECTEHFFEGLKADDVSISGYASAEEFLPAFSPGSFDLVFLDICMDEMNGIELAKKLRAADARLMIVFQTTEREYAFDAFPVHPFDYLIKPCRQDDVSQVLSEAMRVLSAGDPEITVAARGELRVPVRSICAAVARGHNVEIQLSSEQNIMSTETFRSISEKLGGFDRFLLINRGVLINMDHVLSPQDGCMKMKDGSIHPIKVNGRAGVLAAFSQYMISRVDKR